jgi:hypothetical protein
MDMCIKLFKWPKLVERKLNNIQPKYIGKKGITAWNTER